MTVGVLIGLGVAYVVLLVVVLRQALAGVLDEAKLDRVRWMR